MGKMWWQSLAKAVILCREMTYSRTLMMKRMAPPLAAAAAALLFAACTPEPVHADVGLVYVAPIVPPLFYLCCLLTIFLLAQVFIRPMRRRYASLAARLLALVGKREQAQREPALMECLVARYLFVSGLSFIPLCMALQMDAFSPVFGGLANASFSLLIAGIVLALLLWNLLCLGLWAGLTRRRVLPQADAQRREKPKASVPPARAKTGRGMFRWLIHLALAAGLAFALVKGAKYVYLYHILEPVPLASAEAQRELEAISANPALEYGETESVRKDLQDMLHVFSCTHDVSTRSRELGLTPLHLACRYSKPALVEYLLQQGANPNAFSHDEPMKGISGTTPLVDAAEALLFNDSAEVSAALLRIFPMLLEAGADVEGEGSHRPPLDLCAGAAETFCERKPQPEAETLFLLLLEHGASLDSTQNYPYTYKAAENGWVEATRRLLAMDAPLERYGSHAIHGAAAMAAKPGVLACARLLLEAGDDVNARNDHPPYNALMHIIESQAFPEEGDEEGLARCGEMVQLLLRHGARLDELWVPDTKAEDWYSRGSSRYGWEMAANLRQTRGKTIAEVLRERRPELAAWLEAHGTPLP